MVPHQDDLIANFRQLASTSEPLSRCLKALETGVFTDPEGRTEPLNPRLAFGSAALLAHLSRICPGSLSIEVGFGAGSSATVIMSVRSLVASQFEHIIYEPLEPSHRVGGQLVQAYLENYFGSRFRLRRKLSQIGLAQLYDERGPETVGLAFIDGSHHYEYVMTDFLLADMLCCEGGFIVFDDAWAPAIETVLSYVEANRLNYSIMHLAVDNTSVLKKVGRDVRDSLAFKPFPVPARSDWTLLPEEQRRRRRLIESYGAAGDVTITGHITAVPEAPIEPAAPRGTAGSPLARQFLQREHCV